MSITLKSEITRHLEMKACCNIGPRQNGHILEKARWSRQCKLHQALFLESTKSCGHWNQLSYWKGIRIDPNKSKQAVLCRAQGPPVVTIGSSQNFAYIHQQMANRCSQSFICFWFCFFYKLRNFDIFAVPPNWWYENYFYSLWFWTQRHQNFLSKNLVFLV